MVQLYADGVLVYDPNRDGYELLGLKATVNTDKGGTAEIVMPPYHPAYNSFVNQRTIVEIYRDDNLVFRGRSLYPTDDGYGNRTITCEGERCFLRDAVIEPYLYQADPRVIFADAVGKYNAQADVYKRFKVGSVTVRDPNDYQYIKCEEASYVSDVIDKLVEYCGGYITFTTDSAGQRCINWLDSLDRQSGQMIEFGENLLDYTRTDANTELATVIYPYGKKDEETGERLDIKAVNGGKPYVKDNTAIAKHGWIAQVVFWDDVTLAKNLLTKAKQQLAKSTQIISTLELTALDLSAVDKNIDSFCVGDNVRVLSRPHGVDDMFLLRERTYDFLDESQDSVVLGKDVVTLTGSTTANEKSTAARLSQAGQSVTNTYIINAAESSGGSGGKVDLLSVYPVGSIYMSVTDTSPATLFGGTWERIQDRFLLAAGKHVAGSTGGAENVTLTVEQMPSHNHELLRPRWYWADTADSTAGTAYSEASNTVEVCKGQDKDVKYTGGGQPHENMPPYLTVYVWKRTA